MFLKKQTKKSRPPTSNWAVWYDGGETGKWSGGHSSAAADVISEELAVLVRTMRKHLFSSLRRERERGKRQGEEESGLRILYVGEVY